MSIKPPCSRCNHADQVQVHQHRGASTRYYCKRCRRTFAGPPPEAIGPPSDVPGFHPDGNYATAVGQPRKAGPPTVDDVLAEFQIDTGEWIVERSRPGYHEMGYKDADGKGQKMALYSLKVWLVRRHPVSVEWPEWRGANVRPVRPRRFAVSHRLKRRVVMPDCQVGFRRDLDTGDLEPLHDPLAMDCFANVVKELQPDGLDFIGDGLDGTEWTDKYVIEPEFYWTTQASLDHLAGYLAALRQWVGPRESEDEFIYLEGNHEERLIRMMLRNFIAGARLRQANRPTGSPVMSIPHLLGLDALKIRWVGGYPKNRVWINDNLRVAHSEKLSNKSGMSAGKSVENARASMIFGHSHRLESAHVTVHPHDHSRTYGAYNVGTLSRIDGAVPSNAAEENWQQGFAVVDYQDDGAQLFQCHLVNIYNGRCIFEGRLYEAEDDSERMTA